MPRGIAGAVVTLSLLAVPSAHAADTFADAAIGSDANACTSAGAPCATIAGAVGKSGNGDTVRVAPGIYAEQVQLGGGRSLRATGTAASTVIDGPASPAVDVTSAAGTIEGFTIRGAGSDPDGTLRLQAPATVRGNLFDADDDAGGTTRPIDLRIDAGAGAPTVTENSFTDDGVGNQTAIQSFSSASPVIGENRIDGFFNGIQVQGGTPTIHANVVTATHNSPSLSQGTSIGVFNAPADVNPDIEENVVRDPVNNGSGMPAGISILDFVSGGAGDTFVGATLRRNRVLGGSFGLQVLGTVLPVTLDSDLIAGTTTFGLSTSETVAGSGDVTASNATFASNSFDLSVTNAQLTLNSSIVEDGIAGTNPSCAITFSRGPTAVGGGNGCQNFQTTDPPTFVDAAGSDFHLQGFPQNPDLLSGGDPADPGAGARDFDGDPRMLPPNGTSLPNREIGADELLPGGYAPPDTAIESGPPAGGSSSSSPSLSFSSNPAGAEFECALDGRAFSPCDSPKHYAGLGTGSHTFAVRASDETLAGNIDTTPATRAFTVDGTRPETQIDAGPAAGSTTDGSVGFTAASEPGASFECSLDREAFAACPAASELAGLPSGQHTFAVRAVDGVGNADLTPASRTWTADSTPPQTTIDSGPADGTSTAERSATYAFSADEAASFECSTDGGAFAGCNSPATLADLTIGAHTFAVRATDAVGNADQSPATRALTVVTEGSGGGGGGGGSGDDDTDPPNTKIRKVKVKGDDAKARFVSNEPGSTFKCKVDRRKFKRCSSPRRMKNLDDGKHRFKVRAIDGAGNADPSPAKKRFGVETN